MNSNAKAGKRSHVPVTVVIPCYCCADTIERAVISVVNQTMPPEEIVLVDDGSHDAGKTAKVLREIQYLYAGDLMCKTITLQRNQGPSNARNAGWDSASRPFVAFLDADDAWHPRKLEIQYSWMEAHPSVALTGHPSVTKHEDVAWGKLPDRWASWQVTGWRLLFRNWFPARSVMLRRALEFRFDPARRYAEDYLLWLEILMSGYEAWRIELPLACSYKSDFGASGLSADMWKMERGELGAYRRLLQKRRIGYPTLCIVITWSLLRYFRRILTGLCKTIKL